MDTVVLSSHHSDTDVYHLETLEMEIPFESWSIAEHGKLKSMSGKLFPPSKADCFSDWN